MKRIGLGAAVTSILLVAAGCDVGAGTAAPSPSPSETRSPRPPVRRFTISASGDVLIHQPLAAVAAANAGGAGYDFRPMFREVRPVLARADLAICHLETPLSQDGGTEPYPRLEAPVELATGLKDAGFDFCSTASNHSFDQSTGGVASTIAALQDAGVTPYGTATGPKRSSTLTRLKGVTIGLLSYTYWINGLELPQGGGHLVNIIDRHRILRDAARARKRGAEFTVLSMHWGTEYEHEPTDEQRALARRLLRSPDIDLILGHHAHVVQPIERIGGEYVVYGMGNFLSNQSSECCLAETQDGVIVTVHVTARGGRVRVERIEFTPTWVDRVNGFAILPLVERVRSRDPLLQASFDRTVAYIEGESGVEGVAPTRR